MDRVPLRLFQAVFAVIASLVIVPTAINVGTGGDLPVALKPYQPWLWFAASVSLILTVVIQFRESKSPRSLPLAALRRHDPRNFQLALAQVEHYIDGRQSGSLAERARLALALEERPSAVLQPPHLVQRLGDSKATLVVDDDIVGLFHSMEESLLILGAPGAGKTTQLLTLAKALVIEAGKTPETSSAPVPVLLDLSGWSPPARRLSQRFRLRRGENRRELKAWMLVAIKRRYNIPESVGRMWLEEGRVVLLLDGLDEVHDGDRVRLVEELNKLHASLGQMRIAICSREEEYWNLRGRLALSGAVSIKPLTRNQVVDYLNRLQSSTAHVPFLLDADAPLWELLTSPLMLNIIILAAGNQDQATLINERSPARRRSILFDAYIVEVLARPRARESRSPIHTIRALKLLAGGNLSGGDGVRIPRFEEYKSSLLAVPAVRETIVNYILPTVFCAFAFSAAVVSARLAGRSAGFVEASVSLALLTFVLSARASSSGRQIRRYPLPFIAALACVVAMNTAALVYGLLLHLPRPWGIVLFLVLLALLMFERWLEFQASLDGSLIAIFFFLAVVAAVLLALSPSSHLSSSSGATGALIGLALGLWAIFVSEVIAGVSRRKQSRARVFMLCVVVAAFLAIPFTLSRGKDMYGIETFASWCVSVLLFIVPGMMVGISLVGPFVRLGLYVSKDTLPWSRRFLRMAVDRSLLLYTDGEYRFVHLLIRDHLRRCDPAGLAKAVGKRRDDLAHLR